MPFSPSTERVAVTIASSGTTSAGNNLGGASPIGIEFPTVTSTTVSFKRLAADGSTWLPVYEDDGTIYQATIVSNTYLALNPSVMAGVHNVPIVMGSSEASARTLQLVYRPI